MVSVTENDFLRAMPFLFRKASKNDMEQQWGTGQRQTLAQGPPCLVHIRLQLHGK